MSRTRQGDFIDILMVGQRGSYRTRELLSRLDYALTPENIGKMTVKRIVKMPEVTQVAYIVGDESHYTCGSDEPLVVPGITPELLLRTIEIIARCSSENQHVRSVVLLTDRLNRSIERYTEQFFSIAQHLGVSCTERWYVRPA
ncbi:MAG: hypothetical protein QXS20_00235 [Candidatus Thorarchaeota archaeon]